MIPVANPMSMGLSDAAETFIRTSSGALICGTGRSRTSYPFGLPYFRVASEHMVEGGLSPIFNQISVVLSYYVCECAVFSLPL